jgi:hypothetical protein
MEPRAARGPEGRPGRDADAAPRWRPALLVLNHCGPLGPRTCQALGGRVSPPRLPTLWSQPSRGVGVFFLITSFWVEVC